jgi:CheY-like chemotaxis protein
MDVSEISRTGLTQRIIAKRQTDAPEGIPIKLITEINCQSFVLGDATELREVLVNMIFNAVDAMPEGGEIMLRAEEVNESVIISVSDTGIGMSDEVRRRVFDPFFSTKGDAGTGMGLAISFGIIRRHDGNVEVESQLGAGATFRIQLPLASSDELAAAEESAARPPQALSTRPTKFLIIDDEEYVREILKDILEAEGYEVVTAATGQEGIEAFDAQTFDAIFTDVQMPRMTGWEVARAVRERNLRIPLALISGLGETVDTRQQKEALIDWVVSKPFDLERIVKIAGEVAGRRAETTQDDLPQTTSVVEVVTVQ